MNGADKKKNKTKLGKIVIKRELCIGAGPCLALAPETFELDEENIAVLKDEKGNSAEDIFAAAVACPTAAIYLYDEDGELIWPKAAKD